MKTTISARRAILVVAFILFVFACKKNLNLDSGTIPIIPNTHPDSLSTSDSTQQTESIPFPTITNFQCSSGPDYGDTIIYPQPAGLFSNYVIHPVNNPGTGNYYSWPQGLVLNPSTGAINITQSATGQRYVIGFVKAGTTDTCLRNLILAGAAYSDSVYVLQNNETKASPFFNADPNLTSVCGTNGGSGCQWDPNGQLKLQNIVIDNHTGILNLQETLNKKAFGPLPVNGATIQADITYQLSDASNMAIQHTPVKLIYYDKKSNIPQALLDEINAKRTNILDQVLILLGGNPRPPLIIITRFN